jgi:epoxyqueuosine reductase
MDKKELTQRIKEQALSLGFSFCGISPVMDSNRDVSHLKDWISNNFHAEMDWIAKSIALRENPTLLLPEIKSVVMFAMNYFSEDDLLNTKYKISKYALNLDYHWVLKNKLKIIMESIEAMGVNIEYRAFADSGPIFEKSYAVNAGLGWIGKNSCLILPHKGSFFFLATLLLNIELEYDQPFNVNHCGSCTKCIDACPTGAITAPLIINSNKCISYLTIEHKGDKPEGIDFRETKQIFGCDLCQQACPQNRFAETTSEPSFLPSESLIAMCDGDWENLTKSDFKKQFKYSPIQRAGYEKIKSNIAYIRGNDF